MSRGRRGFGAPVSHPRRSRRFFDLISRPLRTGLTPVALTALVRAARRGAKRLENESLKTETPRSDCEAWGFCLVTRLIS